MKALVSVICVALLASCGGDEGGGSSSVLVNLGLSPSNNADARSSYSNSVGAVHIDYSSLPRPAGTGDLSDAIAYIDADNDGDTDVFMATGQYLLEGEVNSILAINDGSNSFTSSTAEFAESMPPATHARKAIVSDFNNDTLADIFVFDHGFDSSPFPGSEPKLILQTSVGAFSWSKVTAQTGFHHGGAAADIDYDGDIDVFLGGFSPVFLINDGSAAFTLSNDRFDGSLDKVFSAELIDVDQDGFIDLLVGAHERDGEETSIFWGSASGAYSSALQTIIPSVTSYGAILDFDVEDVDGDGNRDLVINRTRDGVDGEGMGFYQGRTVQLLLNLGAREFSDVTAENIDSPGGSSDNWFPWIRVQDIDSDGDLDFGPDNARWDFYYANDGDGNFVLTMPLP